MITADQSYRQISGLYTTPVLLTRVRLAASSALQTRQWQLIDTATLVNGTGQGRMQELMEGLFLLSFPLPFPVITLPSLPSPSPFLPSLSPPLPSEVGPLKPARRSGGGL